MAVCDGGKRASGLFHAFPLINCRSGEHITPGFFKPRSAKPKRLFRTRSCNTIVLIKCTLTGKKLGLGFSKSYFRQLS